MRQGIAVSHYRVLWHADSRRGSIVLACVGVADRQEITLDGLDASELNALSILLREERPWFWDAQSRTLSTAFEMTGEEEIS